MHFIKTSTLPNTDSPAIQSENNLLVQLKNEQKFRERFLLTAKHLNSKYNIEVILKDLPKPNTGEFNGKVIFIDWSQTQEQAFYVLCHIFGHTVQWNTDADLRELGLDSSPGKSPEEIARVREYEEAASRMAMTLLHNIGINDLDQWISDMFWSDYAWLEDFYTTGVPKEYSAFFKPNQPMLTPMDIPEFTPRAWEMRQAFV